VERAYAFLDGEVTVVPRRKPIGLTRAKDGDDRLAECRSKVGGEGVVAKNGIAGIQGRNEG
jgi:hypothetical protein